MEGVLYLWIYCFGCVFRRYIYILGVRKSVWAEPPRHIYTLPGTEHGLRTYLTMNYISANWPLMGPVYFR